MSEGISRPTVPPEVAAVLLRQRQRYMVADLLLLIVFVLLIVGCIYCSQGSMRQEYDEYYEEEEKKEDYHDDVDDGIYCQGTLPLVDTNDENSNNEDMIIDPAKDEGDGGVDKIIETDDDDHREYDLIENSDC